MERLATQYGRYGYHRRIRRLLVDEGWQLLAGERQAPLAGLAAGEAESTSKQPKRGRPWLNDGSCVRLRPERSNHAWSYDFVQDRTEDRRPFRMLCVIDEFTRCCLAIAVARRRRSDVLQCLTGVKMLFIEPDSPWENGYCESFNSKLRDDLPNGEMFTTLREAQVLIENWRHAVRPHWSLGCRPPAPEAILPPARGLPTLRSGQPAGWPKRSDSNSQVGRAHLPRDGMRSARCGL
jgi:transposase InsO family protein